jgi:hypothetical protein
VLDFERAALKMMRNRSAAANEVVVIVSAETTSYCVRLTILNVDGGPCVETLPDIASLFARKGWFDGVWQLD